MARKPSTTNRFDKTWKGDGVRGLRVGPARWTGVPLLMKGEKPAAPTPRPAIPKEHSSFLFFFRPILPELGKLYLSALPHLTWGRPWEDPDYVAMCELLADGKADGWVPPQTFFPEFARYVGEGDWLDMDFVTEPPCPREKWTEKRMNESYFLASVHTWITNVDGAYWILCSKDQSMLDAIWRHMEGREGFYCEPELAG